MFERLVENWLTNTNERGYETAFCQTLTSDGHTILHRSPHSPSELGKDLITKDQSGAICGFQLKAGDISLSRWRKEVEPELTELAEYAVSLPTLNRRVDKAYLVTSGSLKEPAKNAMTRKNDSLESRGLPRIELLDFDSLHALFVQKYSNYFPDNPRDTAAFLHLCLSDGFAPVDREQYLRFWDNHFSGKMSSKINWKNTIPGSVLLTSYIVSNSRIQENYWAQLESWTATASQIARTCLCNKVPEKIWLTSFKLCFNEALASLEKLATEAINSEFMCGKPSLANSGEIHRSRITISIGLVCLKSIIDRDWHLLNQSKINEAVKSFADKMYLWGESAVPYFLLVSTWKGENGRCKEAVDDIVELTKTIAERNSRSDPGTIRALSPYRQPAECLDEVVTSSPNLEKQDSAIGISYSMAPLIQYIVHRNFRTSLSKAWRSISFMQCVEVDFDYPYELFSWKTKNATVNYWKPDQPTSWQALREHSDSIDLSAMPKVLTSNLSYLLLFLTVFPHRFNRQTEKLMDTHLGWA